LQYEYDNHTFVAARLKYALIKKTFKEGLKETFRREARSTGKPLLVEEKIKL